MPHLRLHRRYSLALLLGVLSACVDIPPFEEPAPAEETDAGSAQDQQGPRMLEAVPADGSTQVPVDVELGLSFSEAMQTASLQVSVSPSAGMQPLVWTEDKARVTLRPSSPLAEDTEYTVTVTGTDSAGNPIEGAHAFRFTTAGPKPDTTAPVVLSASPDNGAIGIELRPTLKVIFSEPMDKAATEAALAFTTPSSFEIVEHSWNERATELTFKPSTAFPYGTSVAWQVSTLARDAAGNGMATNTAKNFRILRLSTAMIHFDPETSGTLGAPGYIRQTSFYNGGSVGDYGDTLSHRLFLGFKLDALPETVTRIIASQLKWPVSIIQGDPFGKLGALLLEPVDVGDIIEYSFGATNPQAMADYHAPPLAAAMTIPPSANPFRGEFNVTPWTVQDWQNRNIRNKRTQYRLRFETANSGDQVLDRLMCDVETDPILAELWVTYEYP